MPQKSIQGEDCYKTPHGNTAPNDVQATLVEPGAAIPTPESSDTASTCTGKCKIQVVGARRSWGTLKDSTVKSVKSVISHICRIDVGLHACNMQN